MNAQPPPDLFHCLGLRMVAVLTGVLLTSACWGTDDLGPEPAAEPQPLDAVPLLLAAHEEGVPFPFARVLDGGLLDGGRFFVVEDRPPAIHLFAADGRLLDTPSSPGAGPGELGFPTEVGRCGASGWLVWDGDLQRGLRFDDELSLVGHFSLPASGRAVGCLGEEHLLQVSWIGEMPGGPAGQGTVLLLGFNPADSSTFTVASLPTTPNRVGPDGQTQEVLLGLEGMWGSVGDGAVVARSDSGIVHWFGPEGSHEVTVELELTPRYREISAPDREHVYEANLARVRNRVGEDAPLGWVAIAVAEQATVAEEWPVLSALVGTSGGMAAVRVQPRPGDEHAEWHLVSRSGTESTFLLGIDDRVLDVRDGRVLIMSHHGEFGEESVIVVE